jgi:hypothetical protein
LANLGDRARRGLDMVGPHRLDRVDDREIGAERIERGQDVAQVGLGGKLDGGVGKPQPLRPHPHLRCRLLA